MTPAGRSEKRILTFDAPAFLREARGLVDQELHRWAETALHDPGGSVGAAMAYALEELDKITVAAVDGFAVGGGLEVTM